MDHRFWTSDKVKHVITMKKITTVDDMHEIFLDLLNRIEELEAQVERLQSGSELEESVRIFGAGQ